MTRGRRIKLVVAAVLLALALIPLGRGVRNLATTRGAVATYSRLIVSANAGDLDTVGSLCTERYRAAHPLSLARGGGIVGFPRQIHPNFQAWVHGTDVWLCPSNRVGTVYRFVRGQDRWRYDGPVGLLRSDGLVTLLPAQQGQLPENP